MAALDCDDTLIPSETIERMKYVRLTDGSMAKRIVIVTGGDPMECTDTELPTETLRLMATVKVGTNQYADQVVDAS